MHRIYFQCDIENRNWFIEYTLKIAPSIVVCHHCFCSRCLSTVVVVVVVVLLVSQVLDTGGGWEVVKATCSTLC